MSARRKPGRHRLGELIDEARWVAHIGELGGDVGTLYRREVDSMLDALVQAQQLRRRMRDRLEHEGQTGEGCGWGDTESTDERRPGRRWTDREAS